ncbi:WD repeat-containing protein 90 isoform X2 [Alosa sapidissima]|uniref:WD repeat-containing protein 90 isoform X2 n=1 Tax=Alosa sapidissima TaxID=34773 RepID=UPI001C099643|nr:WD repeat-containing protein 90 isoform X2 [Alosa sapidissima]
MSSRAWQHPYVNIFKHVHVEEWKRSSREGDVTSYMDKTLKCSVFRIRGSVPASNYILLPKSSSQSLGLTGRYFYLLFRPSPGKHFVVHLDVVAEEGQVIRVSFSNMFKEFKSSSTCLQLPFICGSAQGSVYESTARTAKQGLVGPAPACVRWVCLVMDLRYLVSVYLNRRYSHLKALKLCANMSVKNTMTSDLLLDPGVCYSVVKRGGVVMEEGSAPMPREMSFPVPKGCTWHDLYDYIRFPSDGMKMPFDSIQKGETNQAETDVRGSPDRQESLCVNLSKPVRDRVSLIQQITTPRPRLKQKKVTLLTPSLPEVAPLSTIGAGGDGGGVDDGGVHVFAPPTDQDQDVITVRSPVSQSHSPLLEVLSAEVSRPISLPASKASKQASKQRKLHPDPILRLNKIIGFGGKTMKNVLWNKLGDEVIYPCHAVIISMKICSGKQRFFIGHTDKVSALALNGSCSLLASVQADTHTLLRLWSYETGHCLALVNTHAHSLGILSFSYSGRVLCGVGKDGHNKTMLVVWNTESVTKKGVVCVLGKAHTDVDIRALQITCCDETRMVSCGFGNVRLWRLRGGTLRSCPLNLDQFHSLEFTDLDLLHSHTADAAEEHTLFVSSKSGHVLEVDYAAVAIKNVRRLLPTQPSHTQRREKQTFNMGPGIAVNSISVCEAFCATASEDGYLRLWPLDFSAVFLEAEHEGPVCHVCISDDCQKVLASTSIGSFGYLDVGSRGYSTLMRSHTQTVLGFSIDGLRRHITTASSDGTVRVWDLDSMQQLYDFLSEDTPSSVAFHPSLPVFCCGSSAGRVRVFDITTASMLAQHRKHTEAVVGCVFSPDGECLFSGGADGSLALYNSAHQELPAIRVLGNVLACGSERAPDALVVSGDSSRLAFIGPTEHTVTIMDARSLDEILRVDVSILDLDSPRLDCALKVCFSPPTPGHLLISTSANKILYLHSHTGKLLKEVCDVQKKCCWSLAVSEDSRFLLTAGCNTLKVWDYNMSLDVNSQVFIGHSEPIKQVSFTPDQMGVVSVGDALFFWDFLAHPQEAMLRSPAILVSPPKPGPSGDSGALTNGMLLSTGMPRGPAPLPSLDLSSIERPAHDALEDLSLSEDTHDALRRSPSPSPAPSPTPKHASFLRVTDRSASRASPEEPANQLRENDHGTSSKAERPDCYKHFTPRYNTSTPEQDSVFLLQSAVPPPPGEEGLRLKAVIGYNGNGRGNMVWNPDTGLFVYTCGCVCVVENLHTGSQRHWLRHTEEISTLTISHDAQLVASASGSGASSKSLICIWNVADGSSRTSMSFHKGAVQSMAFSRDDRYFLSVGDFSEQEVALWSGSCFELLCHVTAPWALHEARFSPTTDGLLACVGASGTLFCTIRTQGMQTELQVQSVCVPDDVGDAELTSLCFNANGLLFTGTSGGQVCVWDCNTHRCFMSWEADEGEIGVLLCCGNRLVCGSNSRRLRLWSVAAVQALRPQNAERSQDSPAVLLEQEMQLDGAVVSATFDDVMDMGIVGTTTGTLWYINWTENTSIRLINGHKSLVNGVVFSPDESRFATCGQDGSLRVWTSPSNELLVQFQVLNQSCECVCWNPGSSMTAVCVSGGYSDGTVRVFNLNSSEMELKLQPHATAVSALQYSCHGLVLLSAGRDGVIAVISPVTGATLRIISDHKGAPITAMQSVNKQYKEFGLQGDELWLAVSADRRVSVWAADWKKDKCELLDWLSFPAPAAPEYGDVLPPSLAAFSPCERGVIVYTGYGVTKELTFYCLNKKQVLRTISLSDWALSLSLCSKERLLAVGSKHRVVKLLHSSSGRFQDFTPHGDSVQLCCFSPSGKQLLTCAHNEILLWSSHSL